MFLTNDNGELQAYTRIIKFNDYVSFGRVLVVKKFRSQGLGRLIVSDTLQVINSHFDTPTIKIQAQAYLKNFYSIFGFHPTSESYLEDGIPHIDMIRK